MYIKTILYRYAHWSMLLIVSVFWAVERVLHSLLEFPCQQLLCMPLSTSS